MFSNKIKVFAIHFNFWKYKGSHMFHVFSLFWLNYHPKVVLFDNYFSKVDHYEHKIYQSKITPSKWLILFIPYCGIMGTEIRFVATKHHHIPLRFRLCPLLYHLNMWLIKATHKLVYEHLCFHNCMWNDKF